MAEQQQIPARNRLLGRKSPGAFKHAAWLDEGDRLLAVGRLNWKLFQRRQRSFHKKIRKPGLTGSERARHWNELEGSPRASWMLIGYAIEMYLKSGLAKAYSGCAEPMFKRDVKSRFAHDLGLLALEIDFHLHSDDEMALTQLKETLQAGRYPLFANNAKEYSKNVNIQTHKQWSDDEFGTVLSLAERIRTHVVRIDRDSSNPGYKQSLRIDDDGYIVFRMGGHLRELCVKVGDGGLKGGGVSWR